MAKVIKYKYLSCEVNHGSEENPNIEQVFIDKVLSYSEYAEEIAQSEAYNSEYLIDEIPEEVVEPTADDVLNAMLGVM